MVEFVDGGIRVQSPRSRQFRGADKSEIVLNPLFKPFFPGKKKPPEPAVRQSEPADDLRVPIEACRARVALEPDSADAGLALAKALHRAGEEREAAAAYLKALDRGAPAPGVHLQLGV